MDSSFVTRLVGNPVGGQAIPQINVGTVLVQPDGKMLLGGGFSSFANRSQRFLGRLNADGTPDYPFNPTVNGVVQVIALQGDRILIGGDFTMV